MNKPQFFFRRPGQDRSTYNAFAYPPELFAAKDFHARIGCSTCLFYPCQILMDKWHNASPEEREGARIASNELREKRRVEQIWWEYRQQLRELYV